jgi:uncharacterized membrane protein YfcA
MTLLGNFVALEKTMISFDWLISLAGLGVGFVVGLTGMGGGALMTPILVLLFGIPTTVAVASDLAASLFMKPLGALVHHNRGTVNGTLVKWLTVGSVPAAFAGAALINYLSSSAEVMSGLKSMLGGALLLAATAMVLKVVLTRQRPAAPGQSTLPFAIRPIPTLAIGVVGGFIVGMTSVGSGSLVIVLLMLLYPRLSGSRLVGTDLAQAIPLVAAAALAHFLFGTVKLDLTAALLVGSIPGVYAGARFSSRAPDHWIRPVLVLVLVASALKLLGASNQVVAVAAGVLAAGAGVYIALRRTPSDKTESAAKPDGVPQADFSQG